MGLKDRHWQVFDNNCKYYALIRPKSDDDSKRPRAENKWETIQRGRDNDALKLEQAAKSATSHRKASKTKNLH